MQVADNLVRNPAKELQPVSMLARVRRVKMIQVVLRAVLCSVQPRAVGWRRRRRERQRRIISYRRHHAPEAQEDSQGSCFLARWEISDKHPFDASGWFSFASRSVRSRTEP